MTGNSQRLNQVIVSIVAADALLLKPPAIHNIDSILPVSEKCDKHYILQMGTSLGHRINFEAEWPSSLRVNSIVHQLQACDQIVLW